MPDVIEFNKLINLNQILSSKICNASIENQCISVMGQILCNKQEKNQNKLNFDLNKMRLNYKK